MYNSKYLFRLAKDINLIILSHADLAHVGALPYLVGKLGCKAKIYATTPVSKMGAMLMYDQFQIQYAVKEFDVFNLDDVDAAFEAIKDFKYSQRIKVDDGMKKCKFLHICSKGCRYYIGAI